MNYYFTQENGCFKAYLYKYKVEETTVIDLYKLDQDDDVLFLVCSTWYEPRKELDVDVECPSHT